MDDRDAFRALLVGARLRSVLVQQFWLDGACVEAANVVLFELATGECVRFFFDGPVFFWRTLNAVPAADEDPTPAAEGFDYPVVRATPPEAWRDRAIMDVAFEGESCLVVRLERGGRLRLEDRDECGTLTVSP